MWVCPKIPGIPRLNLQVSWENGVSTIKFKGFPSISRTIDHCILQNTHNDALDVVCAHLNSANIALLALPEKWGYERDNILYFCLF